MKKRELFREKIKVNKELSFQIDENNDEYINIYIKNKLVEKFKLNRKIYTFFKIIQDYTKDDDYIIIEDNGVKIFGKEIYISEDVFMKINAFRACLTLDFYQKKSDNEIKLVYLTKLIYTSQKLFYMMLIPEKLETKPSYYVTNVFKFIDMIEILRYEEPKNNMNKLNEII